MIIVALQMDLHTGRAQWQLEALKERTWLA
jgi:hypothetical protein